MAFSRRVKTIFLFFAAFLLFGCNKPNPNPEMLDPIYSDLKKEAESAEKDAEAQRAEIKSLEEEIKKYAARDPNRSRAAREHEKREKMLVQIEQRALYYKVRSEQRLEFDRKDYLKAFYAEKPWPDPKEYAEYVQNRKLQAASRNWEDRVPKTTRYNRVQLASEGKKEKKPAEEAPKGH